MLNKKQADNKAIQDIISYYKQEKYEREFEPEQTQTRVRLGDFRVSDQGYLEICNGFIDGQPRWARVPYDLNTRKPL